MTNSAPCKMFPCCNPLEHLSLSSFNLICTYHKCIPNTVTSINSPWRQNVLRRASFCLLLNTLSQSTPFTVSVLERTIGDVCTEPCTKLCCLSNSPSALWIESATVYCLCHTSPGTFQITTRMKRRISLQQYSMGSINWVKWVQRVIGGETQESSLKYVWFMSFSPCLCSCLWVCFFFGCEQKGSPERADSALDRTPYIRLGAGSRLFSYNGTQRANTHTNMFPWERHSRTIQDTDGAGNV